MDPESLKALEALSMRLLAAYATGADRSISSGKIEGPEKIVDEIETLAGQDIYTSLATILFDTEEKIPCLFLELYAGPELEALRKRLSRALDHLNDVARLSRGPRDARVKAKLADGIAEIRRKLYEARSVLSPSLRDLSAWNSPFLVPPGPHLVPVLTPSGAIFRRGAQRCIWQGIRDVMYSPNPSLPTDLVLAVRTNCCPADYNAAHGHAEILVGICQDVAILPDWATYIPEDFWTSHYFGRVLDARLMSAPLDERLGALIQLCDGLGVFAHMQKFYKKGAVATPRYQGRITAANIAGPLTDPDEVGVPKSFYLPWTALTTHRKLFAVAPLVLRRALGALPPEPHPSDRLYLPGIFALCYACVGIGGIYTTVDPGTPRGRWFSAVIPPLFAKGVECVEDSIERFIQSAVWPPPASMVEQCSVILLEIRDAIRRCHADFVARAEDILTRLENFISYARAGIAPQITLHTPAPSPPGAAPPAPPAPPILAGPPDGGDDGVPLTFFADGGVADTLPPGTAAPRVFSEPGVEDAFLGGLSTLLGSPEDLPQLQALLSDEHVLSTRVCRFLAVTEIPCPPITSADPTWRARYGEDFLTDVVEVFERALREFIQEIRHILLHIVPSLPWVLSPSEHEVYLRARKLETLGRVSVIGLKPGDFAPRWPRDEVVKLCEWLRARERARASNAISAFADMLRVQNKGALLRWSHTDQDVSVFTSPPWWRDTFSATFCSALDAAKKADSSRLNRLVTEELQARVNPWDEVRILEFLDERAMSGGLAGPDSDLLAGMEDSYSESPPRWRSEVTAWLRAKGLHSVAVFWEGPRTKTAQELRDYVAAADPSALHFPASPDPATICMFVAVGSGVDRLATISMGKKMRDRATELADALESLSLETLRAKAKPLRRNEQERDMSAFDRNLREQMRSVLAELAQSYSDVAPAVFNAAHPPEARMKEEYERRGEAIVSLLFLLGDDWEKLNEDRGYFFESGNLDQLREYAQCLGVLGHVRQRVNQLFPKSGKGDLL